jgi:hypothetical protein
MHKEILDDDAVVPTAKILPEWLNFPDDVKTGVRANTIPSFHVRLKSRMRCTISWARLAQPSKQRTSEVNDHES